MSVDLDLVLVPDMLSNVLLVIGLIFVSLGIFGLLRLHDVYNRLHATSKIETLGVMLSIFVKVGFVSMGVKAITVGIFLILTVPVSAHMISRAAHRHGVNMCEESVIDEYGETYK